VPRAPGALQRLPQQGQTLVDGVVPVFEDGVDQLVLGAEDVAHQRQRHASLVGDAADAGRVVAALGEQPFRRQQDRLPPLAACRGRHRGMPALRWGGRGGCRNHCRIARSYK